MKLDKKYLLNYIVSAIFIFVAVVFFYNLSAKIFGLDLLKGGHQYKLLKMITSGKMFLNLHNFSLFISFIGFIFVLVGGVKLSMDIEYKNDERIENTENFNNETADKNFEVASKKLEIKDSEKTDENIKNDTKEPGIKENKFSIYDKPKEEKIIETTPNKPAENPVLNPTTPVVNDVKKETENTERAAQQEQEKEQKEKSNFTIDEALEREKLRNKIKEMVNKIDGDNNSPDVKEEEKEKVENTLEPEKLLSKFDVSKIKGKETTTKNETEKSTEKSEVLTAEKVATKMNYETITEEQNMIFENVLIDAGFKLLSEIRIGDTGIDYLGISKEQIAIIQVDTQPGKWMANEEIIADNKYPLWYSENGNKISPFYRVKESVNTIKSLFKDNTIPVNGYVCLTNNTIVNMDEAEEIAKSQNIKILKLEDFDGNEFIDNLNEQFEQESQTEPDTKTLNKMIGILEQAEIPE